LIAQSITNLYNVTALYFGSKNKFLTNFNKFYKNIKMLQRKVIRE